MRTKLASIVTIDSISPIDGADRIEVAHVLGWKIVVGKGEFKPGNTCVMFEIDSALPVDDERYAFLKDRCLRKFTSKSGQILKEVYRIKTAKLRGVISQGLLMPIGKFPELTDNIIWDDEKKRDFFLDENGETNELIGFDVTELLHVEHFDELKAALAPDCGCPSVPNDSKMSDFPTYVCVKSDEPRIQTLPEYFSTMKGRKFEVTEKRDGMSVQFIYSPYLEYEPFAVCSRNMRLKRKTDAGTIPLPWKICAELDAEKKITEYCVNHEMELAFQGELNGVSLQGNRDCLPNVIWQVFKIFDCLKFEYMLPSDARKLCQELGFDYVPVIADEMPVFDQFSNIDDLLKFAEGKTARGNEREGLVFKSCDYPYVSYKAVSNKYLMKENN